MSKDSRLDAYVVSRRGFLRLAGLGAMGAVLAACAQPAPTAAPAPNSSSGGQAQPAATTPPVASGPVEVRVQDWGGDWEQVAAAQFDAFMAENKGIKIVYEPYQEGWEERTLASMVAGTSPDIIHAWGDVFRKFGDRGQLLNLDPLFQETYTADEKADFHAWQLDAMIRDGMRWAMPKHVWLGILYYNKDMFDEAGVPYPDDSWTHDDYSAAIEALCVGEGAARTRWGGYVPAWAYDRIVPKIIAFGGHAVDQETYTKSLFGETPAQEALNWVWTRMWESNTIAQQMQVEKKSGYDSLTDKTVATAEEGTSNLVRVANNFEGNFDIALLPKGPAGRAALGGTNGYAMYKGVEDRGTRDAAWEVMQFLVSPDFQRAMLAAESRTIVPARLSAVPAFLDAIKKQAPVLENVNVEIILEGLQQEYAYAVDPETFKNHAAAAEVIQPALDQLFIVGDARPEIFIQIKGDIEATQS